MRRGGRRGGRNYQSHHKNIDENWSFRPLHDQNINQHVQFDPKSSSEPSTSSTQKPTSDFIPKTPKSPRNRRNSSWISRNRGSGAQFVKKSEPSSSNFHPKQGEEEDINGNKGKTEFLHGEEEQEVKKDLTEGFDPNKNDVEDKHDDVVKRLERLRLFNEEPDLSEEVQRINDQLQEDEVLAMESIYGDNIFILDKQNGLRSLQIHVYIEIPEELTISTKLNSSKDLATNSDNLEDFSYSFEVRYLPPIVLTCLLPKSYPTHLPPYFTISVQWLDSSKISSLCSMLDSIWMEQSGQEVIYSWAEWLHTSALSYLGFDKEIFLGPYGVKDCSDPRAISGCVSPDVDIPSLKSYNDEQRLEDFRKSFHECCICFSEFAVGVVRFPFVSDGGFVGDLHLHFLKDAVSPLSLN